MPRTPITDRLYKAKAHIQYAVDHCPDGGPLGDLEEALEMVGRSADEIEAAEDPEAGEMSRSDGLGA